MEWGSPKKNKMWSLVLRTPLFVLLQIPTNETKIVFVFKYIKNNMLTLYCSLNVCMGWRRETGGLCNFAR